MKFIFTQKNITTYINLTFAPYIPNKLEKCTIPSKEGNLLLILDIILDRLTFCLPIGMKAKGEFSFGLSYASCISRTWPYKTW